MVLLQVITKCFISRHPYFYQSSVFFSLVYEKNVTLISRKSGYFVFLLFFFFIILPLKGKDLSTSSTYDVMGVWTFRLRRLLRFKPFLPDF